MAALGQELARHRCHLGRVSVETENVQDASRPKVAARNRHEACVPTQP